MPPRFIAGMKYSTARTGAIFASPARRSMLAVPPRRSSRPTTMNRLVWMTMWWAT